MELVIRRMEETDCKTAADLEYNSFSEPWSEDAFLEEIHNSDAVYLIALIDGRHVGTAGFINYCGDADVLNVVVHNEFRRHKVAYRLMECLFNEGKKRDVTAYTLEVRKSNTPAILLYESLGFISEGVRPSFYRHPTEDALIMWKRDI